MFHKITAFLPLGMGVIWMGTAQESKIYTHENKDFQDALTLYINEQFQAAQTIFEKVKPTTKDEEIAANSAY
uniref:hypothetical protein n=1 Tax=Maribacter flavus TaxID=1658664 RepID=UPI003D34DE6D